MDIYWKEYEEVHRERFQRKLYRIRLCLGLSSKEFGNLVGVSRQQVNNVESGRTKLRKPLYLAMMIALLEYVEIHKREDIRDILDHVVFNDDKNYAFMLDEVIKTIHIFKGNHHYIAMSDENATWLTLVGMLSDEAQFEDSIPDEKTAKDYNYCCNCRHWTTSINGKSGYCRIRDKMMKDGMVIMNCQEFDKEDSKWTL